MTEGSDVLLYVLFGIPTLFVAFYLFAMGPAGWFVLAFLVIAVMATRTWLNDGESDGEAVQRTNCPTCGAPNPVDAEACGYCDASLAGA